MRRALIMASMLACADAAAAPTTPADQLAGAPCMPPPDHVDERVGLDLATEVASVYEYDAAGKLVGEDHRPPRERP